MTALRGVIALCLVASTYAASSCPQQIQDFLGVNAAKVTLIKEFNGCSTKEPMPHLKWEYEFTDSAGYVWNGNHKFPCWCESGSATKIKQGMKEQQLRRQGGEEILQTSCTSDADCSALECAPWETDPTKKQPTTCWNGKCRGAQVGDSAAVRDESGCVKEGGDLSAVTSTWDPGMAKTCFPNAIIQCEDVSTPEYQGQCSQNNLPAGTTAVEVKSLCTAPPPEPHICKLDADFKASQTGVTLKGIDDGQGNIVDYDLPCGPGEPIGLFDTYSLNGLMRKATGKNSWSDLTCADATKNVTSHWNREYYHHLYAKSTLQEILQSYGAACCGSLAKTIDPCPTPTPTLNPTRDFAAHITCSETRDWPNISALLRQGTAETGGLGKLLTDQYEVWICIKNHPCLSAIGAQGSDTEMMCYIYDEIAATFDPWGLNSELELV